MPVIILAKSFKLCITYYLLISLNFTDDEGIAESGM